MIRIAVPIVAILIGLAALAARSERGVDTGTAPTKSRVVPRDPQVEAPAAVRPISTPSLPASVPEKMEEVFGSEISATKPTPAPHAQNRPLLLGLLERELSLSDDQRRHVEAVLLRREGEIDSHHRQLRTVGAVSGEAYHRHMQGLRAQSYTQIGQVLDTEQHRRFLVLVANGALNDVIGFAMDEGMVALD